MPETVTVAAAAADLPRLIARVQAGEAITIAGDGGAPLAQLVPARPEPAPRDRVPGLVEGHLTDAFFEPLPDDELDAWGL